MKGTVAHRGARRTGCQLVHETIYPRRNISRERNYTFLGQRMTHSPEGVLPGKQARRDLRQAIEMKNHSRLSKRCEHSESSNPYQVRPGGIGHDFQRCVEDPGISELAARTKQLSQRRGIGRGILPDIRNRAGRFRPAGDHEAESPFPIGWGLPADRTWPANWQSLWWCTESSSSLCCAPSGDAATSSRSSIPSRSRCAAPTARDNCIRAILMVPGASTYSTTLDAGPQALCQDSRGIPDLAAHCWDHLPIPGKPCRAADTCRRARPD